MFTRSIISLRHVAANGKKNFCGGRTKRPGRAVNRNKNAGIDHRAAGRWGGKKLKIQGLKSMEIPKFNPQARDCGAASRRRGLSHTPLRRRFAALTNQLNFLKIRA
jgi:hypothetical protein